MFDFFSFSKHVPIHLLARQGPPQTPPSLPSSSPAPRHCYCTSVSVAGAASWAALTNEQPLSCARCAASKLIAAISFARTARWCACACATRGHWRSRFSLPTASIRPTNKSCGNWHGGFASAFVCQGTWVHTPENSFCSCDTTTSRNTTVSGCFLETH